MRHQPVRRDLECEVLRQRGRTGVLQRREQTHADGARRRGPLHGTRRDSQQNKGGGWRRLDVVDLHFIDCVVRSGRGDSDRNPCEKGKCAFHLSAPQTNVKMASYGMTSPSWGASKVNVSCSTTAPPVTMKVTEVWLV